MAQIDIEAALENIQVLVARPIALDFTGLAKTVIGLLGRDTVTQDDIAGLPPNAGVAFNEHLRPLLAPLDFIANIPLNALAQWMNSIQQLAYCNFNFGRH
ncbi:MAG: hypothetical protein ABSF62_15020 [Bryobacteraceae bacterium]|jgi:hypothetical protein